MAKNLILKVSEKGAKKTATALKNVSSAIGGIGVKAGIATTGLSVLSTKLAGDFQKSLFEVSTLTNDFSDKSLTKMSRELRNVSISSGLALSSLSKAKYDIISAGFSGAAESAEILKVSTDLAVGGVTSAAEAADLLTTSINAMGLDFTNAREIADQLFTTVKLGKTTMGELAGSLGQVLPFAKGLNLDLSGVGAAMATLTASGISTAQATTSLRSAIQSLQSPTDASKTLMRDMGIEVKRFDDGTVDLVSTVKQFQGLDPNLMRKLIPRVEGILAIQTMAQNFDKLEENVGKFSNTSDASTKAFEGMANSFNTQMAMLKNAVHSVMIEIGQVIIDVIQPTLNAVNLEFKRLGEIGFDNLGLAVKNQLPEILKVFQKAFEITLDNVEDRLDLFGDKALDLINPFSDSSDKIAKKQALLDKKFKASSDLIGTLFSNMYQDITSDAEINAMRQTEANDIIKDSTLTRYKEELEALQELITNRQNLETEDAEVTTEKLKETLDVQGLAREQAFAKIAEQGEHLIQLGVDQDSVNKETARLQKQYDAEVLQSKLSSVSGLTGALGQLNTASKGSALVSKRLAQATAIIDTYAGANKALSASAPPFNFIAAAAVVAAGLANVATIEKQSFASGGIVQGLNSGAGDSVPAMLTPGELILNQAQQENLAGSAGGLTVNVSAPLVDETVLDSIIPAIEKANRLELA